jgi:signal recognition particle receptor subunit beta
MVQINFAQKQVNAKIVYYGPGMSGKTTNLEVIHQRAPENNRGDLTSISTEGDRTLFFDFMPLDLGTVAGMRTCFQIYTVPGQVYYNSTRKLVLQGVDGVIFVADSSPNMMEENLESLRNLAENLAEYGRSITEMPLVIQYNKRDIPGAFSIDELEEQLNPAGVPAFEAIANTGQGVFPTLKAVAASVLDSLHKQQTSASAGSPAVPQAAPQVEERGAEPLEAGQAAPPFEPLSTPVAPAPSLEPSSTRPTISMSQTGFHKAPSIPLARSRAPETGEPQPAPSELRMAPRASSPPAPNSAQAPTGTPPAPPPRQGLQMQRPAQAQRSTPVQQAPNPALTQVSARAQQAPMAQQPTTAQGRAVQHVQAPYAASATTPASVMGVEPGARAPQRRAPASRSFPTKPALPEPRPTPQRERSAMMTGLIIAASVGVGAVLGNFVLSLFQ